jgi:hypothetical protein
MPDETIRRNIKRKIRIRRSGLTADADIQANIAVNVSRSGSARPAERADREPSKDTRPPDVPPTESEGGER